MFINNPQEFLINYNEEAFSIGFAGTHEEVKTFLNENVVAKVLSPFLRDKRFGTFAKKIHSELEDINNDLKEDSIELSDLKQNWNRTFGIVFGILGFSVGGLAINSASTVSYDSSEKWAGMAKAGAKSLGIGVVLLFVLGILMKIGASIIFKSAQKNDLLNMKEDIENLKRKLEEKKTKDPAGSKTYDQSIVRLNGLLKKIDNQFRSKKISKVSEEGKLGFKDTDAEASDPNAVFLKTREDLRKKIKKINDDLTDDNVDIPELKKNWNTTVGLALKVISEIAIITSVGSDFISILTEPNIKGELNKKFKKPFLFLDIAVISAIIAVLTKIVSRFLIKRGKVSDLRIMKADIKNIQLKLTEKAKADPKKAGQYQQQLKKLERLSEQIDAEIKKL